MIQRITHSNGERCHGLETGRS